MRLIPGKTKVQIELFRGVTLTDVLIALIDVALIIFVLTSTIPGNLYICLGLFTIGAVLLLRLDTEPNYIYLLHILRHFSLPRLFRRRKTENELTNQTEGTDAAEAASAPTAAEIKARRKAERAEYKRDEKLLKSHKLSKEEEDAIWLKRAQQSAKRKEEKKNVRKTTGKDGAGVVSDIIPFTGIKDGLIEYGGSYYGAAIEIPPVEFRFFSEMRRVNTIENSLGRLLRALPAEYAANIVKLERPILYDKYLENEQKKVADLRTSFEHGFLSEEEFKAKVEILCDRINELRTLCYEDKVIQSFYYIVIYDSDRTQLNHTIDVALDMLQNGEMKPHRLDSRELALFLKYSNTLDFDERDIDKVKPEDYAEWAKPESVSFQARTAVVSGMISHNMRVVSYPSQVGDAWLASAMSLPATKVVVKFKPMDRDRAVRGIDRSLQELRGQYNATGLDSRRIELQEHIDTLSDLLTTLQGDNESLLDVNIYVTGYDAVRTAYSAGSKSEEFRTFRARINNMKRVIRRTYQESGLRLNNMEFDQLNAFIGSQISAWDPMNKNGRGIPTNSVAACYPWIFAHISDVGGVKLGSSDGIPVFIDFFRRDSERVNSNMVIVGKSGSGKSYATKSILANLAADDAKIFILDPENEYTELASNLHGKFINVGNAKSGRLNPFHIITALDDDESAGSNVSGSYATHLQFLEEFFRQILPDIDKDAMEYLNSLIDRMYTNMGITAETDLSQLKPEDYPTFDNLYDAVLNEFQATDNEYIHTILRTLMNYIAKFSEGGRNANIWNGPSTVTTNENFTVFNFQSLLSNRNGSIANAQMLLVLKYIDNEIIKNRDYNIKHGLHRKVVVVIDEAHVFIDTKYPIALDFMFQLAKRIRKYNGMQIVITQNIKDFVGSEEIARKSTAIINACQYSFIFSLAPNDMDDLCKLYEKAGGINPVEQEQIVSAPRGQAFTIMSAQSRSSFRVQVPDGVVEMFEKTGFRSHYFSGEDGERAWKDLLADSLEKHDEAVLTRIDELDEVIEEEEAPSRVEFVEMTEDEYDAEERIRRENERAKQAEEAANAPAPAPAPEPARDLNGDAYAALRELADALRADRTAKQPVVDYEAILKQIRMSVREELEREMEERGVNKTLQDAAAAAAVPIPVPVSAANDRIPPEAAPAAEEDDESVSFDIMSMLMMESTRSGEQSPIELMELYDEQVLDVTLEELMLYNSKHG